MSQLGDCFAAVEQKIFSMSTNKDAVRHFFLATHFAALTAGSAILGGLAWNPMIYGFSLFPAGVGALLLTSQAAVVVQTSVHPSIRGRVSAIYTPALLIGVPIGAPLIGLIAEATSPRLTSLIWGAAGLTALIGVVLLLRWRAQWSPQTPPRPGPP